MHIKSEKQLSNYTGIIGVFNVWTLLVTATMDTVLETQELIFSKKNKKTWDTDNIIKSFTSPIAMYIFMLDLLNSCSKKFISDLQ